MNHVLRARRLGIDTYRQPVVFMRADCPVCRSEGFEALTRIRVDGPHGGLVAMLNVVHTELLRPGEASVSEHAWRLLALREGDPLRFGHAPVLESFRHVRAKMYGGRLDDAAMTEIVSDIGQGNYPDVHISAFLAACADDKLDHDEVIALTRSMIAAGERLSWGVDRVVDKHCVGGLPGNRTTPLVVAIAAAAGLVIPKTSSRAITSPAGTADVMETVTRVELTLHEMRAVVERCGGCLAWGGSVRLSPVDDLLIRVERALDIDSEGQLIASVLSKKAAAGSTDVLIDIPFGPTAKVRSEEAAHDLARDLVAVGRAIGLQVEALLSDGSQPVGRGIGPALEAADVLAVLRRSPQAPADLRERGLLVAGKVLELGGAERPGEGIARARELLDTGAALARFEAICEAQGGLREPEHAAHTLPIAAPHAGMVAAIDNRKLAKAAKLAGAPGAPTAGLELAVRSGDAVAQGEPVFVLHAESTGELHYAAAYVEAHPDIVQITEGGTS